MQGLILALEVKKIRPETSVLILAEEDDPETVDEETEGEQPFVYLRRPVDIHHGPLPPLNVQNARGIIKQMLVDVGAMAIILSARNGEVLLEDGAPGYL